MLQSEFFIFIRFTLPELAKWCSTQSFNSIMNFKYEFQKALTVYSKSHKMDAVQEKAISILTKLEKWCRDAFIKREMIRLIGGSHFHKSKNINIKSQAREAWEEYNRRMSY